MRNSLTKALFGAWLFALIASCQVKGPAEAESTAQLAFEHLRVGDMESLLAKGTAEMKAEDPAVWQQMRDYIPAGEAQFKRTLDYAVVSSGSSSRAQIGHEYIIERNPLIFTTLLTKEGDMDWQVAGLHLYLPAPEEVAAMSFSLGGKQPAQYLFLVTVVAMPLLMLTAIVLIIRAPGVKRKWLWSILALTGIGAFQMNWITGAFSMGLLSINLIGTGVSAAPYGPWILSTMLPVGALICLWRVAKAHRQPAKVEVEQ